jgi:DUF1009 family protein
VPTIGRRTLDAILQAGGRVLAVEAERTIILDEPDLIDFANRNRLIIVALEKPHGFPSRERIPQSPSRSRER